ncbi:MAG: RNA polymerase sigma factor [Firmicutes bacterium]|nr:RNA polymerase sigma factor [Bacillota bacterium]
MDILRAVAKAKQGDKEALLDLIMAREREFFGLSYLYMRNEQDAADVMQDMIVILLTKIHTLKKDSAFYSWAKQILVRCCLSRLRQGQRDAGEEPPESSVYDPDSAERMDLLNAVHALPEHQRDVVLLFYYNDRSFEEISEILDCPVGTVKSRLHQGLKKLKGRLGDEYRKQA